MKKGMIKKHSYRMKNYNDNIIIATNTAVSAITITITTTIITAITITITTLQLLSLLI